MFEKVNPSHPDKLADRIAGALVDMAYGEQDDPKIAVEVLLGHGNCYIIYESSVRLNEEDIMEAVFRITGSTEWYFDIDYNQQDEHLAENQSEGARCGDNGIFMGCPVTPEQALLSGFMGRLYDEFPHDGKAVLDDGRLVLCQSNADTDALVSMLHGWSDYIVNPLGPWTGGPDVDTGATNRKLGSDMGDAVTGGGIHGKDLSKADVSVNIACHLMAQELDQSVTASCAIGDTEVTLAPEHDEPVKVAYAEVVEIARKHVEAMGGFERLAEWGLV